ncbi:hypothetical protein [Microbacterium sp.]|uniref:hypothetical protein n=1 Tax=Microbacterium sp. TaxID=51671 RepID=UPI002733F4F3|nr:hypothetical protein [Microbacterium sp.]MDP3949920.1 hypothetical protein [Microbacterium sp.]
MATQARIDGVAVELVFSQRRTHEVVADRARTLGGTMRQDVISVKDRWELRTRPLASTQSEAVLDALEAADYGPVEFWLDDFGSTTVTIQAFFDPASEDRIVEAKGRRSLSLTAIEQ